MRQIKFRAWDKNNKMSKFDELKKLIDEELELSAVVRERKNKSFKLIEEIQAEQEENQLSIADTLDVIDDSVNYVKLQKSFKDVCSKSAEEVVDEMFTESEIKEKDERYLPFAVKVEEDWR